MAGTVALDAVTALTSAVDVNTTHTPTGTPRAVLFGASQSISPTDQSVSAPVYGGVSMSPVSGSPLLSSSSSEDSAVYLWFLGAGVPTGAQTVTWDVDGTGSTRRIWIVTFTASGDVEVVDTTTLDADAAANVNTLTIQAGARTSWAGVFSHHALNAVANLTVTTSGWTERDEHDFGSDIAGLYTKDTNASGDLTVAWSTTANNRMAAIGIALDELAAVIDNVSPGGVVVGGAAPAVRIVVPTGGTVAGGSAVARITIAPGGAVSSGSGPAVIVPASAGGVVVGGVGPTDPGSGVSETPTPGGALAGGTGPSARVEAMPGGGTTGGTSPSARVGASPGGVTGGGAAPSARAPVPPGGAIVGGQPPPSARAPVAPSGATAGGAAPSAWVTTLVGGVIVGTNPATGARVLVDPGGAIVGGLPPTDPFALPEGRFITGAFASAAGRDSTGALVGAAARTSTGSFGTSTDRDDEGSFS